MQTQFDIAVIGGGLAGLCFAIQAADAGFSVVLFEKEVYPFHKVCGEYISFESYDFLMRLGLPLNDWKLPAIKKLTVTDVQGNAYHFPLDLGGFGISRYTIDSTLYHIALQKNVSVLINTKVNGVAFENDMHFIQTNKNTYTAKVVAGAYGKRSNLDIKWKRNFTQQKNNKLNNYVGVKYHVRTEAANDIIALHNFKNGYCGISKIEGDKFCLCYLTNAKNLADNNNSIDEMQQNILYKNKVLKEIFNNAEFVYESPVTISQISFEKKSQVEDHILMLGDAAGMITPLSGNGMSMAMRSSVLAMQCANSFLCKKINRLQMEKSYVELWKKEFASRLATGRLIQRFMGNNYATSTFLKSMNTFPSISKRLIQSTHGKPF